MIYICSIIDQIKELKTENSKLAKIGDQLKPILNDFDSFKKSIIIFKRNFY